MILRQAKLSDIPQIQRVRNAVKENRLSHPSVVPDSDVADYITRRGCGWVFEFAGNIVGFAIVSVQDTNVWALFVDPGYEQNGIGGRLHDAMLEWYFTETGATIWLSTAPGTRAEKFYELRGWQRTGITTSGEVKFEMTKDAWLATHRTP